MKRPGLSLVIEDEEVRGGDHGYEPFQAQTTKSRRPLGLDIELIDNTTCQKENLGITKQFRDGGHSDISSPNSQAINSNKSNGREG